MVCQAGGLVVGGSGSQRYGIGGSHSVAGSGDICDFIGSKNWNMRVLILGK